MTLSALRLIVGLGNPGPEHARTRHNAGFWFLDALAKDLGVPLACDRKLHAEVGKARVGGENVWLLKPTTYMNRSGLAVVSALGYFKIDPEQMLVAHDELDLPPGTVRLKFDGGHGGQNGLRDILGQLGHGKFHRLRVGIGHPGHKDRVTPWVLGRPGKADEEAITGAVIDGLAAMPLVLAGDVNAAMKRLHTKKERVGSRE
jgi:PTH1 family peptidyl-tRNA hydrolase